MGAARTSCARGCLAVLAAVLHKEEDMYVAECLEVGTVSQGQTVEEAISNLKEATELYLQEFRLEEGGRSIITTCEVRGETVCAKA